MVSSSTTKKQIGQLSQELNSFGQVTGGGTYQSNKINVTFREPESNIIDNSSVSTASVSAKKNLIKKSGSSFEEANDVSKKIDKLEKEIRDLKSRNEHLENQLLVNLKCFFIFFLI
jgi:hypothetical protein